MIYLLAYIYILSAWRAWWWIRMAYYHPLGKWNGNTPDIDDYWGTFCPTVNTGFCVITLFNSWKIKQYNNDNIFKPKKPLI